MIKTRISFLEKKPTLYLVSTPIGNLKDITLRAIETLKEVDLIYAEDTRVTLKLLEHYKISNQVLSYHSFNEEDKANEIFENLEKGLSIALCTDAGTPGISDPGYYLTSKVKDHFPVVSIPGASALLTGLVSSGLVVQPFTFVGFPERKKGKRISQLESYKKYPHTLVFYERGQRVLDFVNDLHKVYGKRKCVLAKELTKVYETFYEFTLGDNIEELNYKGEFVVMISGYESKLVTDDEIIKTAINFYKEGNSKKDTIKLTSLKLNVNKNKVYDLVININMEEIDG